MFNFFSDIMLLKKMIVSLVCVILFFIMDVFYLSLLSYRYVSMLAKVQNGKMPVINWSFAIMSYMVLAIVLSTVVFPYITILQEMGYSPISSAFFGGFLIGFAIYGVYNTTVLSVFKDYSVVLASIDTIWGSTGFFLVSLIYLNLQRHVFFSS